jgi:hypothetical protein
MSGAARIREMLSFVPTRSSNKYAAMRMSAFGVSSLRCTSAVAIGGRADRGGSQRPPVGARFAPDGQSVRSQPLPQDEVAWFHHQRTKGVTRTRTRQRNWSPNHHGALHRRWARLECGRSEEGCHRVVRSRLTNSRRLYIRTLAVRMPHIVFQLSPGISSKAGR